jgi:hypothetical protein
MKTGILPLVALGIGAWFLAKPKKETASSETKSKGVITGSKDERGYVITNCNLVIYDEQKAYDYAYSLGADNTKPDYNGGNSLKTAPLEFRLLGDCISTEDKAKSLMKTKNEALFIFTLLKFFASGVASKSLAMEQWGIANLEKFKSVTSKILGFDTSDFKVELVKKT